MRNTWYNNLGIHEYSSRTLQLNICRLVLPKESSTVFFGTQRLSFFPKIEVAVVISRVFVRSPRSSEQLPKGTTAEESSLGHCWSGVVPNRYSTLIIWWGAILFFVLSKNINASIILYDEPVFNRFFSYLSVYSFFQGTNAKNDTFFTAQSIPFAGNRALRYPAVSVTVWI